MDRREFLQQQIRKLAPVFIAGIFLIAVLLLIRIVDIVSGDMYLNIGMVIRVLAVFIGAIVLLVFVLFILGQLTERLMRLLPDALSQFIRRHGSKIVSAIIYVVIFYQMYLHRELFSSSYYIVPGIFALRMIIDYFKRLLKYHKQIIHIEIYFFRPFSWPSKSQIMSLTEYNR